MTKDIHIIEIHNRDKKSFYTKEILEMLPEWFGNRQALNEYVEKVKKHPYYAALNHANKCLGFFSIENTLSIYRRNTCMWGSSRIST